MVQKQEKIKGDENTSKSGKDHTWVAYNGIKNLLFQNKILLGQQLNSRRLGKQLNMSSTPILQALRLLHFQGLLAHFPQRGYFLEQNTREDIKNIFNLRLALESANLDYFLENIDDKGRQTLETAIQDHKEALKNNWPNKILKADMQFHISLSKISTGEVGANLCRMLFEMMYLKGRSSVLYSSPNEQFSTHHEQIVGYLDKNDIESARNVLITHIRTVRDLALQELDKQARDRSVEW